MIKLSSPAVDVRVFVYREGLLSAAGHDVELLAKKVSLELELDTQRVRAEIWTGSLEVLHALQDGKPAPGALSAADRLEIQRNLARTVLEVDRFPSIYFEGRVVEDDKLLGALRIHGVTHPLDVKVKRDGTQSAEVEARLDQRRYGIKPFTALLGALKVKPEILVRARVTLPPPKA